MGLYSIPIVNAIYVIACFWQLLVPNTIHHNNGIWLWILERAKTGVCSIKFCKYIVCICVFRAFFWVFVFRRLRQSIAVAVTFHVVDNQKLILYDISDFLFIRFHVDEKQARKIPVLWPEKYHCQRIKRITLDGKEWCQWKRSLGHRCRHKHRVYKSM